MKLAAALLILVSLVMPPTCFAHSSYGAAVTDVVFVVTGDHSDLGDGDSLGCETACCCGDFLQVTHCVGSVAFASRHDLRPLSIALPDIPRKIFVPPESQA